jgi:DNA-binding NtrC family response regulator
VDLRLPDVDGLDLLAAVRERQPDVELMVITGYSSIDSAVQAGRLGAFDYLPKPFTPDELRARACAASSGAARAWFTHPPAAGTGMIGDSQVMQDVHALVARVAPTDATVLITGESGTGKELLATALHAASRRRRKPMVSLDCSTLSPGLLESELFGHVKGSFTGAIATKPGLFETADAGTLFLDEVSSLSLETQGKLLRTLESGELKPVGGVATRRSTSGSSPRPTATWPAWWRARRSARTSSTGSTSSRSICRRCASGRPTSRRCCIAFLARHRRAAGRGPERFSPAALDRLVNHPWPGNVRELKNVVERLVVTVDERDGPRAPPAGEIGAAARSPRTRRARTRN